MPPAGIAIALFAALGAPLFAVLAALALLLFHGIGIDPSVVIIEMSRLSETPMLQSLPLFIFAGSMLSESKAASRLLTFTRAFFGRLPGGLAVVALLMCAFLTAFNGATGVTIFTVGGILLPALLQDRYPEKFSLGLLTTGGSLGLLFPPSLPLILYGVISGARIDALFLAGMLPGLFMLLLLSGYAMMQQRGGQQTDGAASPSFGRAIREAAWELPLPFLVLGGIYGGLLVVGEAAAVAALYVLVVQVFVYRDIAPRQVPGIMARSMMLFGGIFMVLAASLAFTNYLVDQRVPMRIFEWIRIYIDDRWTFLLVLNLFLLGVGALLDIFSALVLVVPILVPLAQSYGVDLLHLGIIFLTNLQIGYCTPPVGMDLFLASYRFERPIMELYRATLPFLLIELVVLAIITYVPELTLMLTRN